MTTHQPCQLAQLPSSQQQQRSCSGALTSSTISIISTTTSTSSSSKQPHKHDVNMSTPAERKQQHGFCLHPSAAEMLLALL
jgi:hypothetical protein